MDLQSPVWFQVKYFQPVSRTQPRSTISFDGLNRTHSAHTSISTALSCRQKPVVMLHVSPILVKWCIHNPPPKNKQTKKNAPVTSTLAMSPHTLHHQLENTHGDTLPHRFHTRTHFYYYIFAPSETSLLDFKVGWCTMLQMPYISSYYLQVRHFSVQNIEYSEICKW